jgi:hypothetical protein
VTVRCAIALVEGAVVGIAAVIVDPENVAMTALTESVTVHENVSESPSSSDAWP